MRYVLVQPAEVRYQKDEPLTYATEQALRRGSVVTVPYGRRTVLGIVTSETKKPDFKTRPIHTALEGINLPQTVVALSEWMHSYYPGGGAINQLFVPSGIESPHRTTKPKKHRLQSISDLPPLTPEQVKATAAIGAMNGSLLLHGQTGSGKSRVYFEAALECIASGRSSIILTPEIALVPQLKHFFEHYLGTQVVEMHSGLTKATRSRNWLRIHNAEKPLIIIGTRLSLFSPVKNLGLIIVDEMHEPAYKQDSAPRYYALRVAGQLARIHGAKLVYGSATPPVSDYYLAQQTKRPIIRMTEQAVATKDVTTTIIDMRNSKNLSPHPYLSSKLVSAIQQRLSNGQQTLLFLNRRGTARQILCIDCGWQSLCPNCDTPLVYHGDRHQVVCHTCGYNNSPPYNCPQCSNDEITYRSLGTKALTEILHGIFPEAVIRRFDTDNKAAEKLDRHFDSVRSGEVDILVGTQMLGKGLDLPKLSLLGIINADTGLGMPDFSAAERSYQLLHQAIGRVGRGHTEGEVIVQTYNPDSSVIRAAVKQDWKSFYIRELAERKQFLFPPFCFLLKITASRKSSDAAKRYLGELYNKAISQQLPIQVSDPAPSFYERSHGNYNWQLIVRSKNRDSLIELVRQLPQGDWQYDLDPINLF